MPTYDNRAPVAIYIPSLLRQLNTNEWWKMKRYLIEREIEGVESLVGDALRKAACNSNQALAQMAPDVQWVQSYVVDGRTVCEYIATSEAAVLEHAEISGFPANRFQEVHRIIDPLTAG